MATLEIPSMLTQSAPDRNRREQAAIDTADAVTHQALASEALQEARTDMKFQRPEAALAWAAIAQAHIALARELRESWA